ncbi:MAG: alkaline phosphatase family protein [Promethearchaeota archaeon]
MLIWCYPIKNIILGIDGGCFESIDSLLQKNLLPNFRKLIENGVTAKLEVTVPPVTIPSWPCLFSGMSPEQLGYYWFDHPTKGLFNSSVWKDKSIFSIYKIKQFILNVPGTYPAWKVNGEMITGMMSPSISCYPTELKYFLQKDWIIDAKEVNTCFKAFDMKKGLFLKKLSEDFDLLIYVIRLPDTLSHNTHLERNTVINYINLAYRKIDDFIYQILNEYSFDNLIIFSDHGLKFYDYEFNIRRWLEKKRLLYINESQKSKFYSLISKLFDIIRPVVRINYEKVRKLKIKIFKDSMKDFISSKDAFEKSKVMSLFGNVGAIFLNDKEKKIKEKIITTLNKDKRVKETISLEIKDFPDIIIVLNDKYLFDHNSSMFVIRGRNTMSHIQNGFFIAYGNNINKTHLEYVNYKDIAPTLLKLFGINKLDYMKGTPLNIFKNVKRS